MRHTKLCCIQFRKLISWDLLLSTYSLRTFMGGISRENKKNCTRKLLWKPFGSFLTFVFWTFSYGVQNRGLLSLFHNCYFSPSHSKSYLFPIFFFIFHPKVLLIFLLPWSLLPAIGTPWQLALSRWWSTYGGLLASPSFIFHPFFVCIWDFGCLFNPRASPYLPKVCIARVTLSLESCAGKMSWS